MTTKTTQVTVRLGGIQLDVHQLEDGSYAAPGLFRLLHTEVYRYGECWYWLGKDGLPDLTGCKFWGRKGDVFLAFQLNRLCYRYADPVDPESELYVPIPCDIQSAIEFCVLGKLASEKGMIRLNNVLDRLCLVRRVDGPSIISAGLLKNTASGLPGLHIGVRVCKDKKSANALKKPKSKNSSSSLHKPGMEFPRFCDGIIYLVKLDAHLKLGFTRSLDKRLNSFKTTNDRVELIKTVYGTLQDEKYLHSILDSKVRELYDFRDEKRIIQEMLSCTRTTSVRVKN